MSLANMFALFLFSGLPYPPPNSWPFPTFSTPKIPYSLPIPTPTMIHHQTRPVPRHSAFCFDPILAISTWPPPWVISCLGYETASTKIAKGRTNVELREQFILAEGVSQSMTPFKSKPSPNSSVSSQSGTAAQQRSQSLPNSGPIIKVCFSYSLSTLLQV